MPKGSTYPVATSPDAFDALGVQGGVTKKLSSTLLATQAELDAHAHTGTYVDTVATQGGTASAPTPKEVWRFNAPAGDTHGPFGLVVGGSVFQGFFDRTMYLGYNVADEGGRAVAAEPSYRFSIESHYYDGTNHLVEPYFEWAKAANASRSVTDGVTTNGSSTVTSATVAFTTADVGVPLTGTGIPGGAKIVAINSATSAELSANATATATGVTFTLTPTAQQRRPWFMQIDRATGLMRSFQIRTKSIMFTDWDDETSWGSLSPTGLAITPRKNQACELVLGYAGGLNTIQVNNNLYSFVMQPLSIGADTWLIRIGGTEAVAFAPRGIKVGDQNSSFNGAVTATVSVARKDDTYTFYGQAQVGQTTSMLRMRSSALDDMFVTDPAPAATDETIIRTWINGALKRIVVGAADSAGTGFRTLRVAN